MSDIVEQWRAIARCACPLRSREVGDKMAAEIERLTTALERIALLDEADGHELEAKHAFRAVAIATSTLGKHPSEIIAARKGET